MRIITNKYEWPVGTEDNEVNFFSPEIARVNTEIDLYDFMIQGTFSGIEYNMTGVDEKDNTLYIQASQCSFDCLNEIEGVSLIEYFELYTVSHLTKWKVEIYDDDDNKIYTGIIYKDGIELDEVETQILSIKILGYEKEFSEYFKNKLLVGTDQIEQANLPFAVNLTGLKWYSLHRVLKANFPGVQFDFMYDLTHFVGAYYVVDKPYFYSPKIGFTEGLVKFRAGYDSFVLMQTDVFSFFNSLCLGEGWKWLFVNGRLCIRNAFDVALTEIAYDYNETFLTHSLNSDIQQFAIDNILIPDGGYHSTSEVSEDVIYSFNIYSNQDGYRYIGGNRDIFFSEKNDYENNLRPFHHLTNVGINNALYRYYFNNYFTNFQEEEWTWAYRNKKFEMYNVNFLNHYDTNERFLNFKKNNTLNINPVVCSADYGGTLDMTQARVSTGAFYGNGNAYRVNHEVGNHGFWYTGSVSHCVAKYSSSPQGYYSYEDRILQDAWRDNMKSYLSTNATLNLNIEVYDLQTNPLVYLTVSNYEFGDLGGKKLNVTSINFNPITNKTTYSVSL